MLELYQNDHTFCPLSAGSGISLLIEEPGGPVKREESWLIAHVFSFTIISEYSLSLLISIYRCMLQDFEES